MICKNITLSSFRNIKDASLSFSDGVNILTGDNGQGKTNIIEAIYLASVGRSFRGADEAEMVKFDSDNAMLSVDFADSLRKQNITLHIYRDRRRQAELNRVKITRLSDLVGTLSTVLFCPEHLSVVKDGPLQRRSYLDVAISQLRPVYMGALQRYVKILKQRNKLIRSAVDDRKTFDDTIVFWSEQLAVEAALIAKMRVSYLRRASALVADFFRDMTRGGETPELIYSGSSKDDEELYLDREAAKARYMSLLTSSYEREIAAGTTLWGIHKDDITINLNGRPARVYASQGQQRSLALAMKLAEGEICRCERGEYPVLLLDDVLSELDAVRRAYLINEIRGRQVIMTTCESVPVGGAQLITVRNGTYERRES